MKIPSIEIHKVVPADARDFEVIGHFHPLRGEEGMTAAEYSEWLNVMLQDPDSAQSREFGQLKFKAGRDKRLIFNAWRKADIMRAEILKEVLEDHLK